MPNPAPNAVVIQRLEVAAGLVVLRVAPLGWDLPAFRPGQFAVLGLPGSAPRGPRALPEDPPAEPDALVRRAYSIASSSREREYLEFYIAEVRSGALSPRLCALEAGDRLWMGPRFSGVFTLDQAPRDAHLALVATGTGLAPYMSMLRTHLDGGSDRRVAVLHGARHARDLGYRLELFHLQAQARHFTYLPLITRPDEESEPWTGATGRLQDAWTRGDLARAWGFEPSPEDTHVFLCGNPRMVEAMTALLQVRGFRVHSGREPGQIHFESYW